MALIEVYHVVASILPIDADATADLPQGILVSLDTNGNVVRSDPDSTLPAIGIAGDTRSTGVTSYTPESGSAQSRNPTTSLTGSLITGAFGASQRYTQNRVADNYNEVLASGKMTVYHGGGEFWTDQYELVRSNGSTLTVFTPASLLWASGAETANAANEPEGQATGRFTDELSGTAGQAEVGRTLTAPTAYPSGVPGTETAFTALPEGGNSLTWGNFLHVKLEI